MSQKRIPAKQLLTVLLASGLLSQDQVNAAQTGRLAVMYDEKFHAVIVPNSVGNTGAPLYEPLADKEYGVTNLDKGGVFPEDFVITHVRTRLGVTSLTTATLAANLTPTLNAPRLKAMEFDNMLQTAGANQIVKWPSVLLNSQYEFGISGKKQFQMSFKNFFINNNRKDEIEASIDDCVAVPNDLILVKKGQALEPIIYLPQSIAITDPADNTKTLVFGVQTTLIGYTLGIR